MGWGRFNVLWMFCCPTIVFWQYLPLFPISHFPAQRFPPSPSGSTRSVLTSNHWLSRLPTRVRQPDLYAHSPQYAHPSCSLLTTQQAGNHGATSSATRLSQGSLTQSRDWKLVRRSPLTAVCLKHSVLTTWSPARSRSLL